MMDGFHDFGGFQAFGKVPHTINRLNYQPVFNQIWEHLAYSLMFIGTDHLKKFSVDDVRHAVERLPARLSAMMEKAQHRVSTMTIAKLYRRRKMLSGEQTVMRDAKPCSNIMLISSVLD